MAILKKYIGNNEVGAEKILLEQNAPLRAEKFGGGFESLLKLDSDNIFQLLKLPRVAFDPIHDNDIVRKSYIAARESALRLEIDAVEAALSAEEQRAMAAEQEIRDDLDAEIERAMEREAELQSDIDSKIPLAYIGAANGVTPLGADQKIPTQYLPALAIAEVFVVTTIAQRDALTVQSGDVAKVTEAVTSSDGTKLPRSYIYSGTAWVELNTESDVDSVAGRVGHVVLDTRDVSEFGDYRYYTPAREAAMESYVSGAVAAEAALREAADLAEQEAREAEDLTFVKLDGSRRLTGTLTGEKIQLTGVSGEPALPMFPEDVAVKAYVDQEILALEGSSDGYIQDLRDDLEQEILDRIAGDAAAVSGAYAYTDAQIQSHVTDKLGVSGGIATLDSQGKLPVGQLPALAITDVYVVTTIAERDALTVEEGDVAKVIQAELHSDGSTYLPRTYIYAVDNDTQVGSWLEIISESDVMSVAGRVGHVTLETSDVSESASGPLYFTDARARTAAVVNSVSGGYTDQAPSVAAVKGYIDQEIQDAKDYTDGQLDMLIIQELQYEAFVLSASDVTAGKIQVDHMIYGTPFVMRQGIMGRPGIDFSFDEDEITFLGEWAVSGLSQIAEGDAVYVWYMKQSQPYAA